MLGVLKMHLLSPFVGRDLHEKSTTGEWALLLRSWTQAKQGRLFGDLGATDDGNLTGNLGRCKNLHGGDTSVFCSFPRTHCRDVVLSGLLLVQEARRPRMVVSFLRRWSFATWWTRGLQEDVRLMRQHWDRCACLVTSQGRLNPCLACATSVGVRGRTAGLGQPLEEIQGLSSG